MAKAASQKKGTRKDKAQEEHLQKTLRVVVGEYILDNLKGIGIAAVMLVIVAIGGISWFAYQNKLNAKALVLEDEALRRYDEVRTQATAAQSEKTKASYQDVLAKYQQIINEYPKTGSAERVLFLSGSLEYQMGNYANALEHFNAYIKKYPEGQLRLQAEESMGYVFEQQGAFQKAIDQLKSIEGKIPSSRKSELLLAIGRNYAQLQQPEKAIEVYQQILDANTAVGWKDKARERLGLLRPDISSSPLIVKAKPEEGISDVSEKDMPETEQRIEE